MARSSPWPRPATPPTISRSSVEDGEAAIFIAGDASYSVATMLAGAIDGVSEDESQAAATLATIRAFASATPTIYLPAHDPKAAERLAGRWLTPHFAPLPAPNRRPRLGTGPSGAEAGGSSEGVAGSTGAPPSSTAASRSSRPSACAR
jgi:hypothetical protein